MGTGDFSLFLLFLFQVVRKWCSTIEVVSLPAPGIRNAETQDRSRVAAVSYISNYSQPVKTLDF